jgi:uncharacterized protein YkwD
MPQDRDLLAMINAYRASPPPCAGQRKQSLPALAPQAALSRVRIESGQLLDLVLENAGYPVEHAEAIYVAGARSARDVMALIGQRNCQTLLSTTLTTIGASRDGDTWLILLAQPALPPRTDALPGTRAAALAILQASNKARAAGALCGTQYFAPAAPLAPSSALDDAALAHSADMVGQRYFSHQGKDGRQVGERAVQAGYVWRTIGENIAVGQESADDVVQGWLDSPGHCANIMNPAFQEMGAAYAVRGAGRSARVYWTQVFGKAR